MVRAGIGYDMHRLVAGRALILGGVRLEHPLGLEGHSDADVLSHAVADALLGAVAAGDIGQHFPDTSDAWKDACSLNLLSRVAGIVAERGGTIVNVDATLLAERPKIAPHVTAMRRNIADALSLPLDRVSVKATTVERLGAIGREEGMAAMAVAMVETVDG
jgi:2-C-methyl-D-erythritol 2,4-cyclodiphosphate synthase